MKKRVLKSIVWVLLATMCMGMTCFAKTTSPGTSDTVVQSTLRATDASGKNLTSGDIRVEFIAMKDSKMPAALKKYVNKIKTKDGLEEAVQQSGADGSVNWVVADVMDVFLTGYGSESGKSAEELKTKISWPVSVSFKMAGVGPKTNVQLVVWDESRQTWVKVKTTVGDGIVTGEFEFLGPVAFLVDPATMIHGITSPKTSASNTTGIALIGLFAIVAACNLKKKYGPGAAKGLF